MQVKVHCSFYIRKGDGSDQLEKRTEERIIDVPEGLEEDELRKHVSKEFPSDYIISKIRKILPVSSERIWELHQQDQEFRETITEEQREVIRPFALALPEILREHLEKPASIENICHCKVIYLRYCMEKDFVEKMLDASSPEMKAIFDVDMLGSTLVNVIDVFDEMQADIVSFLKHHGLTEEQLLESIGFSRENIEKQKKGELTIGDLLMSQPIIITKNT